jgi:hypothetical protein
MDVPNILYIHKLKHSLPQVFFAGETMPQRDVALLQTTKTVCLAR